MNSLLIAFSIVAVFQSPSKPKAKPVAPQCQRCEQTDGAACGGSPTRCAKQGKDFCCVR